jgi:hypothetical protein
MTINFWGKSNAVHVRLFETSTHQQIVVNDYSQSGAASITFDLNFTEDPRLRDAKIYIKNKKTDSKF